MAEHLIIVCCVVADEIAYSISDIKVVNYLHKLDSLKFTTMSIWMVR